MRRPRHRWPVFVWAAVIWIFSTEWFGMKQTSSFILPVLRWFFPHASIETLTLMHLTIRKIAHIVVYSIFSILALRAIRGESRVSQFRWALIAIAISTGYACTDELHQYFVPGRGPSVFDVMLDAAGATLGQAWIAWRDQRHREALEAAPVEKPGTPVTR